MQSIMPSMLQTLVQSMVNGSQLLKTVSGAASYLLEKVLTTERGWEAVSRCTYESMLRGAPIKDIMPLGQNSFSSKLPRRG